MAVNCGGRTGAVLAVAYARFVSAVTIAPVVALARRFWRCCS
jgi:hypothetical protein